MGPLGRASVLYLDALGKQVVVVDRDPARLQGVDYPTLVGDVTDDSILEATGIGHAHALIAALNSDADNVYVTLSSRALRPDLVIIARARTEESKAKLLRSGANPGRQSATDRRAADGGVCVAASCGRVP